MSTMVVNLAPGGSSVSTDPLGTGSSGEATAERGDPDSRAPALGSALRRAWVGYQRSLDAEMARAGFSDRRFPDGRVLRLCAGKKPMTASQIGRELGITRQGAAKIIGILRDCDYITVLPSSEDAREKTLVLTTRGRDYLAAQRQAGRRIEQRVRADIGEDGMAVLAALLNVLGGDTEQPRLREYLKHAVRRESGE